MIVPVKKAKLFVLKDEQAKVIRTLQKNRLMMVDKVDKPNTQNNNQQKLEQVTHLITSLKDFKVKSNFFEYHALTYDEFVNNNDKREDYFNKVKNTLESYYETKNGIDELEGYLKKYNAFKDMDMNPSIMKKAQFARFHTGFIHESKLLEFEDTLKQEEVPYQLFDLANEGKAVLFVSYIDEDQSVMAKVEPFNFQPIELPNIDNNLKLDYESVLNQKQEQTTLMEALKSELSGYADDMKNLYAYADYLKSLIELDMVVVKETKSTHFIEGWVREDEIDKLETVLKDVTSTYELELNDPSLADTPPTALKNNKFVSQFETITDMFSVPNHTELDPNPVMSIWYWIIFGIMMGDVGYGLAMVILSGLFIKYKRPKGGLSKLVHIFFYTGFTTIISGVLFGSLFGFSVDFANIIGGWFGLDITSTLIEPVNDPIPMLIFSLAFGVLHLLCGLAFKLALLIKRKDYMGAFADALSWMLVLIGVSFIAGSLAVSGSLGKAFSLTGIILSLTGAAIVLLFAARSKKSIVGRLFGGIGALYGASGYLSDVLSYSRILALSLSSAVIASTMNILAGMVSGSVIGVLLGFIIYLIGHVFNLVMGLLSAYVHDGRLQYIEFFGKFYEGGGYRYEPFSIETNYINEIIYEEKGTK